MHTDPETQDNNPVVIAMLLMAMLATYVCAFAAVNTMLEEIAKCIYH